MTVYGIKCEGYVERDFMSKQLNMALQCVLYSWTYITGVCLHDIDQHTQGSM